MGNRALERYARVGAQRTAAVPVLEPQAGSWWNQNTFGDKYDGPFPVSEGIIIGVLPKNDRLYGPPAVHSVQLARGDNAPAQNADVRALISYGTGGAKNSFLCDWLHGAQFALVCNQISVSAVTYAPDGQDDYDPQNASLFLAAMVAKGDVSKGFPLTFTEASEGLIHGTPLTFPVRDFAREVIVHVLNNNNPQTPTKVDVEFETDSAAVLVVYDAQVCAGGVPIPIPGGTTNVRLLNNDTMANKGVMLQWVLGL